MKRKHYFHVFGPDVIQDPDDELFFIEMNHGCFILTPYNFAKTGRKPIGEDSYREYFTDHISSGILDYTKANNLRKVVIFLNAAHYCDDFVQHSFARVIIQLRLFGISLTTLPFVSRRQISNLKDAATIEGALGWNKTVINHNEEDTLYISNVRVPGEFDFLRDSVYDKGDFINYLLNDGEFKAPLPCAAPYDADSKYPNLVVKPSNGQQGDGVRFFKTKQVPDFAKNMDIQEFIKPKNTDIFYNYSQGKIIPLDLKDSNRATDLRVKLAASEDGRVIPLFTYRKFSRKTINAVLPDGECSPDTFLTNISKGGFLSFCSLEEQTMLKEYGKKIMPKYIDYLKSKKEITHVSWTGGFDSTYAVMKFLLEGREVQPIYFSKVDLRGSQKEEKETMKKLQTLIRETFPEFNSKLHDVEIVEIEQVEEIEKSIQSLGGHGKKGRFPVGTQTAQMAHFCSYFPNVLHVGIEHAESTIKPGRMSRTYEYFKKYITLDDEGCGKLDSSKMKTEKDKLYKIYKNLRFPIWTMTKMAMYEDSKDRGFSEIMENTWTCWYPERKSNTGNGCGTCFACKGRATVL